MSKGKFNLKNIQTDDNNPEIHKIEAINKEARFGTKKFLVTTVLGLSLLNGCSNNASDTSKPVTTTPTSTVKNSPTTTVPSSSPVLNIPPATIKPNVPPTTKPETTPPANNINPHDICTCDPNGGGGFGSICSCDQICTCNLIYY